MAEDVFPGDFKEFLKLLNENGVKYLLVGGFAVGYHGYPRATADMDVWVAVSPANASRLVRAFRRFGMDVPQVTPALFQRRGKIIRMGVPPLRIEVLTGIDGVDFAKCFAAREEAIIDKLPVNVI